jgi:hypothetical protein
MWYSSLTPFASTYRPEVASASEDALKRTPASDAGDASVSDGGSSQTVADAGSVAASVRDLSKPIDVGQMSPEQAKGRYDQLKAVLRYGGLANNMSVNAMFGDQKTNSMETFLDWLQERGKTADPNKMVIPLSLIDLKA